MGRRGNGEESISRHKKSGLYMARYTVQTTTGPKRKTIYGKTRREVDERTRSLRKRRLTGIVASFSTLIA